ncbi:MAG TPA: hypothetical protein VE978_00925 [Chitinophagales bacterium]|nr:hypothetical protein [Chitinophagales bacterium]
MIDPDMAFLALFLAFGNLLIPAFIAVLIFKLLKKKMTLMNTTSIFFKAAILSVIFFIGICLWAVIDVLSYTSPSLENLLKDFHAEFLGWLPALFSLALFIPIMDRKTN